MKTVVRIFAATIFLTTLAACQGSYLLGGIKLLATEGWTYTGTWVNPWLNGYDGGPPGKIVVTADSIAFYDHDYDSNPLNTGSCILAAEWADIGARCFKCVVTVDSDTAFFLMRVSRKNEKLETDFGLVSYPVSIDPAHNNYSIFSRR